MQNVQQLNSISCIYIVLLTQLHCTQQEQGAISQAYMWQNSHTRRDWNTATATTVTTSSWLTPKLDTSCFSAPFSLWTLARCSKPRWMRPSFSPWSCNVFSKSEIVSASLQTKQYNYDNIRTEKWINFIYTLQIYGLYLYTLDKHQTDLCVWHYLPLTLQSN